MYVITFTWEDEGDPLTSWLFNWGEKSRSKKFNRIMYTINTDLQTIQQGTVHKLNGISGGDVDLVAGSSIIITPLPAQKQIQISAAAGGGSNPHLHVAQRWALKAAVLGSRRGCTIFNDTLLVTGYDQQAGANKITEFDLADLPVLDSHSSAAEIPWDLTHDENYIYEVDNNYRDRVYRYDPTDWSYTQITLGSTLSGYTYGIEWDPGLGVFWITDDDGYIYQFPDLTQPYSFQESLFEGNYPCPSAIAYDPDHAWLWISYIWNYNSHKLLAIDTDRQPQLALENCGDWMGLCYHQGASPEESKFYGICQGANSKFWVFKGETLKGVI